MHPPDSQKKRYQNDARPAGRAIAHATDARATHAFPVPIMPSLPHALSTAPPPTERARVRLITYYAQ